MAGYRGSPPWLALIDGIVDMPARFAFGVVYFCCRKFQDDMMNHSDGRIHIIPLGYVLR